MLCIRCHGSVLQKRKSLVLDEQVDEVEIIGIDGNHCVKETALGALENGFKATVNERAVASMNKREFEDTKQQLRDAGVAVISE